MGCQELSNMQLFFFFFVTAYRTYPRFVRRFRTVPPPSSPVLLPTTGMAVLDPLDTRPCCPPAAPDSCCPESAVVGTSEGIFKRFINMSGTTIYQYFIKYPSRPVGSLSAGLPPAPPVPPNGIPLPVLAPRNIFNPGGGAGRVVPSVMSCPVRRFQRTDENQIEKKKKTTTTILCLPRSHQCRYYRPDMISVLGGDQRHVGETQ